MIDIELTNAIVLYAMLIAALIGGIWLYTELSVRRTRKYLGQQFLWRCVYCGFSYLDEHAADLSQCPRCHSYNSIEGKAAQGHEPSPAKDTAKKDEEGPRRNPSRGKRKGQRSRGPRRRR